MPQECQIYLPVSAGSSALAAAFPEKNGAILCSTHARNRGPPPTDLFPYLLLCHIAGIRLPISTFVVELQGAPTVLFSSSTTAPATIWDKGRDRVESKQQLLQQVRCAHARIACRRYSYLLFLKLRLALSSVVQEWLANHQSMNHVIQPLHVLGKPLSSSDIRTRWSSLRPVSNGVASSPLSHC